jgi:hypothetical protein
LLKNKVGKQKDTPLPLLSFCLSAASGRLRNSPSKIIQAQTVLAAFHLPLKPKARQRGLANPLCATIFILNYRFNFM